MGAASSVAAIPFVGPVLPSGAFTQMKVLGVSASRRAAFDVVIAIHLQGMMAQIHQGKMIVSTDFAFGRQLLFPMAAAAENLSKRAFTQAGH